jgi:transcriptional regulator with XRE-family HTH domain
MLFHERLEAMRQEYGWKLLPLAEKSGYTRPTIRGYESGKTPPPAPEIIRNLCRAIGAPDETGDEMVQLAFETQVHLQAINNFSIEELFLLP